MHTHMCTYMCGRLFEKTMMTDMHTCTPAHIHMHMCMHTCTHAHMHMCMPMYTCMWAQAIGRLFEKTMMTAFSAENVKEHFAAFDTICDATQARRRMPTCT